MEIANRPTARPTVCGRVRKGDRITGMKRETAGELFVTFCKIGAFTFGGGYAMIPLIRREVVEEKKWLAEEEMFDLIAIAESTPGPLAINAATFVGSRVGGILGAFSATFGVVLPSFFIILLIAGILARVEHISLVQKAFRGIRAGVLVLIASALISLCRQLPRRVFTYLVLAAAFAAACLLQADSIVILILCALCGILWKRLAEKRAEK